MSFGKEVREAKHLLRPVIKPVLKVGLLFQSGAILEAISDTYFKRTILPEPFDFPSHIGNFREAAMATVAAYAMTGIVTLITPLIDKSHEIFRRNAQRAAVGAFAASSAIQVIGEKYNLTNGLVHNTGDALDAAYGIGWSAVVALGAYHMINRLAESYLGGEQFVVPHFQDIFQMPELPEE